MDPNPGKDIEEVTEEISEEEQEEVRKMLREETDQGNG